MDTRLTLSSESPRVLIIDDDPDIVRAAQLLLGRAGMTVAGAGSPDAAWVALAEAAVDVVLLDLNFSRGRTTGDEGFAMLERLLAGDRDAAIVVVTGHSGITIAVRAMKAGATDFVVKPWSNERLLATVERAITLRRARRELAAASAVTEDQLLGEAPAIVAVRQVIARVAPTTAAVLVRGPAGAGKTLVARLLHAGSSVGKPPAVIDGNDGFVDLPADAAALLIENVDALGRAEQRALLARLGTARVIATSRLCRAHVREALIDDLYHRLSTIEIDLPPLAVRVGDVARLARHFLDLFASRHGQVRRPLADEALRALDGDPWPDNVRSLRQACERAVLLGSGARHEVGDFGIAVEPEAPVPRAAAADLNLERGEKTLVAAALQRHAFNVSRAAAELGLTRAALYRRMEKHGL